MFCRLDRLSYIKLRSYFDLWVSFVLPLSIQPSSRHPCISIFYDVTVRINFKVIWTEQRKRVVRMSPEFLVTEKQGFLLPHREGNGNPLQHSCLENPMGGGAWWAAVHEESDLTGRLHFHFSLSCSGERNGNPLQCSYLENPRDGGAW